MGIYYCAIDVEGKKKFESPKDFSIKSPGIFHPTNPFPNMVVMMNSLGYEFEIYNDANEYSAYYDDEIQDITDEVYEKYLTYFPWARKEIYEPGD